MTWESGGMTMGVRSEGTPWMQVGKVGRRFGCARFDWRA